MSPRALSLLVCIILWQLPASPRCLDIKDIPHGVLMEKGLEVRSTRVQWDIVMVLEDATPQLARIIRSEIDAVQSLLNVLPDQQGRLARRPYWNEELKRMRAHIPKVSHHRRKRALLGVVGLLSRALFGRATV